MICLEENIFLIFCILYLILIYKYIFIDSLHSIHLSSIFVDNQKHFSKRSLINNFFNLKILEWNLWLSYYAWFLNKKMTTSYIFDFFLFNNLLLFIILLHIRSFYDNKVIIIILVILWKIIYNYTSTSTSSFFFNNILFPQPVLCTWHSWNFSKLISFRCHKILQLFCAYSEDFKIFLSNIVIILFKNFDHFFTTI